MVVAAMGAVGTAIDFAKVRKILRYQRKVKYKIC